MLRESNEIIQEEKLCLAHNESQWLSLWLIVRILGLDIHCLIYILVFCFPLALCLVHSVTIKFSPCLHSFLSKRSHILIKTFSVFMMRKKKKSKSFGPTYCFLPAIFFHFWEGRAHSGGLAGRILHEKMKKTPGQAAPSPRVQKTQSRLL